MGFYFLSMEYDAKLPNNMTTILFVNNKIDSILANTRKEVLSVVGYESQNSFILLFTS